MAMWMLKAWKSSTLFVVLRCVALMKIILSLFMLCAHNINIRFIVFCEIFHPKKREDIFMRSKLKVHRAFLLRWFAIALQRSFRQCISLQYIAYETRNASSFSRTNATINLLYCICIIHRLFVQTTVPLDRTFRRIFFIVSEISLCVVHRRTGHLMVNLYLICSNSSKSYIVYTGFWNSLSSRSLPPVFHCYSFTHSHIFGWFRYICVSMDSLFIVGLVGFILTLISLFSLLFFALFVLILMLFFFQHFKYFHYLSLQGSYLLQMFTAHRGCIIPQYIPLIAEQKLCSQSCECKSFPKCLLKEKSGFFEIQN